MAFKGTDTIIEQLDGCVSDRNDISVRDIVPVVLNNGIKADFGNAATAHTLTRHINWLSYKSMGYNELLNHYRTKEYL
jgi:hypothetical protein